MSGNFLINGITNYSTGIGRNSFGGLTRNPESGSEFANFNPTAQNTAGINTNFKAGDMINLPAQNARAAGVGCSRWIA